MLDIANAENIQKYNEIWRNCCIQRSNVNITLRLKGFTVNVVYVNFRHPDRAQNLNMANAITTQKYNEI